jgi:hypothetical protein
VTYCVMPPPPPPADTRAVLLDGCMWRGRDEQAADLGAAARVELGVAFHSSVYQKSLCGVLGNSLPPIAQTLVDAKQDLARTVCLVSRAACVVACVAGTEHTPAFAD